MDLLDASNGPGPSGDVPLVLGVPGAPAARDGAAGDSEGDDPEARTPTRAISPGGRHGPLKRAPRPGERLGRCRLIERIGAGGSAVVFRAHHLGLDAPVAVKVLTAADGAQLGAAEARLLARLDHPHLVRVLDADLEGPVPHLVLELVDGPTLHEVLRARGALPPAEAARIALEVAHALEHAAARGILHRDLKPSNILLASDGRVRVADLGVATLAAEPDDAGEIFGTLAYLAPERLRRGAGPAGARADLWSLGVVLYEMLTGAPPWRPSSPGHLLEAVEGRPPPAPHTRATGVPPGLSALVLGLLCPDPEGRPDGPAEVAAALAPFAGAAPAGPYRVAPDVPTLEGSLERSGLTTLVQVLHASGKTGDLVVRHEGGEAHVDLERGEVTDVRGAGDDPEAAFRALARVERGTFAFYEGRRRDSGRVRVPTERLLRAAGPPAAADPARGP